MEDLLPQQTKTKSHFLMVSKKNPKKSSRNHHSLTHSLAAVVSYQTDSNLNALRFNVLIFFRFK